MIKPLFAKLAVASSFTLLLTACSQTFTGPVEYYQFEQPINVSSRTSDTTDYQLRVSSLTLRGALNNRGIAIKLDNNQINAANYHLWSEAPDLMLSASAHQILFTELDDWMVIKGLPVVTDVTQQHYYELEYELQHFYGDNQGNADISGLWRLYLTTPEQGRSLKEIHYFNEVTPLIDDDYQGLVATLEQSWQKINRQVAAQLKESAIKN